MKKKAILLSVIGLILIGYGIIAYVIDSGFFSLTATVGNLVIGATLIFFAVFVTFPHVTKSKNRKFYFLWITEFAIIIAAAIIGFILPVFNVKISFFGNGSFWLAITLLMEGIISIFLKSYYNLELKKGQFFINIGYIIFGVYVYAKNLIDGNLKIVTLLMLLITGLYLIIIASKDKKTIKKGTGSDK